MLKGLSPKKKGKDRLDSEADAAFLYNKVAIVETAITTFLRPSDPLTLRTDVSDFNIGATEEPVRSVEVITVLFQEARRHRCATLLIIYAAVENF